MVWPEGWLGWVWTLGRTRRLVVVLPDWDPGVDEPLYCDCPRLLDPVEFCLCCFAWAVAVDESS